MESQVSTFYSKQSQELSESEKEAYEQKVKEVLANNSFDKKAPEDWGGYQIDPSRFWFLQTDSQNQIHSQLLYSLDDQGQWNVSIVN